MGSQREQQQRQPAHLRPDPPLVPAALVEQEDDEEEEGSDDSNSGSSEGSHSSDQAARIPAFDVPYFRYIDEEEGDTEEERGEEEEEGEECSGNYSRSLSSLEDDFGECSVSHRYGSWGVGTPYRVLEHLLNHLKMEDPPNDTDSSHSGV